MGTLVLLSLDFFSPQMRPCPLGAGGGSFEVEQERLTGALSGIGPCVVAARMSQDDVAAPRSPGAPSPALRGPCPG